ncbi:MAG: ABC transporter substrate-binding protein [Fibrobacterota bacterium]
MGRNSVLYLCLSLIVMFLSACENMSTDGQAITVEREEALYIGGHIWAEPDNFNPLNSWPVTWPATANSSLLYEPLFGYNVNSGQMEPILGREWSLSGSLLIVELQDQAFWSDGTPLTNDDVLYSFGIHDRFDTHYSYIWRHINDMDVIEETGQLVFELDTENYNPLVVKDAVSTVPIIPEHVFGPIEDAAYERFSQDSDLDDADLDAKVLEELRSFKNIDDPIGSGPYTVAEVNSRRVVLSRVEKYWGNDVLYDGRKPAPKYIVHPVYESNSEYNHALIQGDLDVTSTFFPQIDAVREEEIGTWFEEEPYYIPGSIPSLLINHGEEYWHDSADIPAGKTKRVLQDSSFRRAVDIAINRRKIREKAIYNYSPELRPGYIINHDMPTGNLEGKYYSTEDARAISPHYFIESDQEFSEKNIPAARETLIEAGYYWVDDSVLITPDDVPVAPLKITCPSGWSDWETAVEIVVEGMSMAGIPVESNFINEGSYWETLARGHFDFIVKTPQANQAPSLPWSRFESALSARDLVEQGQWASRNEGRYDNPRMDSLIARIPRIMDDAQREDAYGRLNRMFMREVPAIPLMYRPSVFYQFNTHIWKGFPTYDDGKGISPQNMNVGASVQGLWELYRE